MINNLFKENKYKKNLTEDQIGEFAKVLSPIFRKLGKNSIKNSPIKTHFFKSVLEQNNHLSNPKKLVIT